MWWLSSIPEELPFEYYDGTRDLFVGHCCEMVFRWRKKKEKLKKKVLLVSLAILKDESVVKNTVGYQYRKVNVFSDFELDLFYIMLVAMRKMVENAICFAENNQSLWHCVCRFRLLLCALLWGMIPNVFCYYFPFVSCGDDIPNW